MEKQCSGEGFLKCCDEKAFIWKLLNLHFQKNQSVNIVRTASSMYEQNFEFSKKFEELIAELWNNSDSDILNEIAKESLKRRIFEPTKHFYVVAKLVDNNVLEIKEAIELISLNIPENYLELHESIRRLVDVVWLIIEDEKDNVMSPEDDELFCNTLMSVLQVYKQ